MASFGTLKQLRSQFAGVKSFEAAFAYLDDVFCPGSAAAERLRAVREGETQRIELAGGAFALEQAYRSKSRSEGFFESHRRFIDVQVIVAGEEAMEVVDAAAAQILQPYDVERDLIKYSDVDGSSVLRLRAGDAAVFFPADVHMPGLAVAAGRQLVRKTVVKVPV